MLYLRPQDLALVHKLIRHCLPDEVAVWAYGSRVNGNAHEGSDLDLVLRGLNAETGPILTAGFRRALHDSNLPILVDVHDWNQLPANFHQRILARYEVVRPATEAAPAVPLEASA